MRTHDPLQTLAFEDSQNVVGFPFLRFGDCGGHHCTAASPDNLGRYSPSAGYTSLGYGFACTIPPMSMQGLSDRFDHAWFTPCTTTVSPARSRTSSVSVTREISP